MDLSLVETEPPSEEICHLWFCFALSFLHWKRVIFLFPGMPPEYTVILANFEPKKSYFKNTDTTEVTYFHNLGFKPSSVTDRIK